MTRSCAVAGLAFVILLDKPDFFQELALLQGVVPVDFQLLFELHVRLLGLIWVVGLEFCELLSNLLLLPGFFLKNGLVFQFNFVLKSINLFAF